MKCYFGGSKYYNEYPFVAVCFANNAKEAKRIMWKKSPELAEECDSDYLEARVKRQKLYDYLLDTTKTEAYLVHDIKTLRLMEWRCEGESPCANCELYPNDLFHLCENCDQCSECGHHEDCDHE